VLVADAVCAAAAFAGASATIPAVASQSEWFTDNPFLLWPGC
jgi:hypothetical protein